MPSTYEPIATQTVSSTVTNVTFSSIPATYTDLVFVVTVKSPYTGANLWLKAIINSDTGANYSQTYLAGDGSAASSGRYSNRSDGIFVHMTNSTYHAPAIINFQNYANTNVYKTALARMSQTISTGYMGGIVGLWRNTNAITSIKFDIESLSNGISSGSTFTLYGIKAA